MSSDCPIVSLDVLEGVYASIRSYIQETPLLESPSLSELTGGKVWVKAESLQITGAFKFRGALYRLTQLSPAEKNKGVAAYSSGNFACGLAKAGQILNIPVHLVMPHNAPDNKIASAKGLGAVVMLCHASRPSREEAANIMATHVAKEEGYTLLHPFDDPILVKGQATVGIELQQQLAALGQSCHHLLCPAGGGSLVAGCSLIFLPERTNTQVYSVEVEGFDGMRQSLAKGKLTRAAGQQKSHCDALLAVSPGQATFQIARHTHVKGLTVRELSVKKALRLAFTELHLVLEPSGAVAIGAIIEHPERFSQQNTVVVASGGNVDIATYQNLLKEQNT
ncbi:threonine/serine dehydratase [Candidatus Sororendozoicomonas aggregata]|uniref:threonine/serine dehydratase n=1 Tax=Candidatus Sororendozoicomonas aggregata TaxID=3073239 RepID=UPI002ED1460A